MDLRHLHHITVGVDAGGGSSTVSGGGSDRFPQWCIQETRDLLMIRAELDSSFMETKRNKLLWEVISTKMKGRGYNRSAQQCKCKWKNLVTRYKGCETMEQEDMKQQFPFYNELQAIFTNRMQRLLWMEAEGATSGSKKRLMQFSSDDEDDNEDSDVEKASGRSKKKKKAITSSTGGNVGSTNNNAITNLKEVLEEFMKQQMQIDMQWMKRYEAREDERRMQEMEWRQTMVTLEKERIMLDDRWREREEQRRMRDEARAEKRDALITELLNKLRREDL